MCEPNISAVMLEGNFTEFAIGYLEDTEVVLIGTSTNTMLVNATNGNTLWRSDVRIVRPNKTV